MRPFHQIPDAQLRLVGGNPIMLLGHLMPRQLLLWQLLCAGQRGCQLARITIEIIEIHDCHAHRSPPMFHARLKLRD
jgi:hypothetical protein